MRTALAAVALVVGALIAGILLLHPWSGKGGTGEAKLILTTFPGIDKDVQLLLVGCEGVEVRSIAPPGGDPHTYNLRPEDVRLVEKALLIISTGHAPFEARIEEIAPEKTIIITRIPGIKILQIPGGAENLHMPIYDPDNYRIFVEHVAARLQGSLPGCSQKIRENLQNITRRLDALEEYGGILSGRRAAAASPLAQYAVHWLGVKVEAVLVSEHGAQVAPESAIKVREIVKNGGILVVVVDEHGNPLGSASESLLETAQQLGAPLIKVEAPFTSRPLLVKIEDVARQAAELAG